jgi:hypothetical protein
MFNPSSASNLIAARDKTKRDSTRILSYLSGNSRVVSARTTGVGLRNKIFVSFLLLIGLVGAVVWFLQRPEIQVSDLSSQTGGVPARLEAPLRLAAENTILSSLPELPSQAAAQIVNEPNEPPAGVTSTHILTLGNPLHSAKANSAQLVEETTKPDKKFIEKNTAKNGLLASPSSSEKAEPDADVTLLAALIQGTATTAAIKKPFLKKHSLSQGH